MLRSGSFCATVTTLFSGILRKGMASAWPSVIAWTEVIPITFGVQEDALLDEQDADDLLGLCGLSVHTEKLDLVVDRDATMSCQTDLPQSGIIELGVNRQHEYFVDGGHGLMTIQSEVSHHIEFHIRIRTCLAVFSCKSKVAPMIVTVSERRSPPRYPTFA